MKRCSTLLAVTAVSLLSWSPLAELPIGADMPKADKELTDVSGKKMTLKDAKKRNGLLVMFSCNTCPYVVKNQSRTKDIAAYALKNEVGVVLLNSNEAQRSGADSYKAMQDYAAAQEYKWAYVVDEKSEMADAFGATRTPENFLFNAEGKLVYHGAIDDNPELASVTRQHLKTAVDEMLNAKDVSVKTSRSVGCGIKRAK